MFVHAIVNYCPQKTASPQAQIVPLIYLLFPIVIPVTERLFPLQCRTQGLVHNELRLAADVTVLVARDGFQPLPVFRCNLDQNPWHGPLLPH